jgi:hypothetical protein
MVEFVRRGICTLVVIVVALLSAASQASARTVPQGFYGVNYSGNVEVLPFGIQSQLWNRLATGGAESARLLFNWDIAEKTQGNYNWSRIDSLVLAASQRRMKILATVEYAPPWAKLYPGQVASPPRSPSDYAGFLKQLIKRYGANGDFWKGPDLLHPHRTDIPYNPVEEWAIWNEPEIGFHWYRGRKHPWGKREALQYAALLNAAYTAVHASTDPTGKVVMAALSINAPQNLQHFYDWTNIKGKFDISALQAYAGKATYIPTLLTNFRNALNHNGATNVPLYVTEMTWPAAKGHANPAYANTGYMKGFITDKQGAANRLTKGYSLLRAGRAKWNLQRVFWYQAESPYSGNFEYDYSGLLSVGPKPRYAIANLPVYTAYQNSARSAEGCAKATSGACK